MNIVITVLETSTAAELDVASTFLSDLAGTRSEYDAPKVDTPKTDAKPTEPAEPARRTRKPRAAAPSGEPAPAAEPSGEPAPAAEPASTPAAKTSTEEWDTNKTFTEADVQALATVVARAHGPDVVKEKIAELGGARIADLDAANLNQLGAFLEAQK